MPRNGGQRNGLLWRPVSLTILRRDCADSARDMRAKSAKYMEALSPNDLHEILPTLIEFGALGDVPAPPLNCKSAESKYYIRHLCKLYCFAEACRLNDLANKTIDKIRAHEDSRGSKRLKPVDFIPDVYNRTSKGSQLRRYFASRAALIRATKWDTLQGIERRESIHMLCKALKAFRKDEEKIFNTITENGELQNTADLVEAGATLFGGCHFHAHPDGDDCTTQKEHANGDEDGMRSYVSSILTETHTGLEGEDEEEASGSLENEDEPHLNDEEVDEFGPDTPEQDGDVDVDETSDAGHLQQSIVEQSLQIIPENQLPPSTQHMLERLSLDPTEEVALDFGSPRFTNRIWDEQPESQANTRRRTSGLSPVGFKEEEEAATNDEDDIYDVTPSPAVKVERQTFMVDIAGDPSIRSQIQPCPRELPTVPRSMKRTHPEASEDPRKRSRVEQPISTVPIVAPAPFRQKALKRGLSQCMGCKQHFSSRANYKLHKKMCLNTTSIPSPPVPTECPFCRQIFHSKGTARTHRKETGCSIRRPWLFRNSTQACATCHGIFTTEVEYNAHLRAGSLFGHREPLTFCPGSSSRNPQRDVETPRSIRYSLRSSKNT